MDFLFTALQIREHFGQFLHGNWNNKLGSEKSLEKYIILNFSGQLTLNEPVSKWMEHINLSQDTFCCCMCSPVANTEACLWSLLLSMGHSSRVEPSKEVIFKVEERIIHIKGHLLSNLKWFTAVCGAARTTSPLNSMGLKLGHTAIISAKLVWEQSDSSLPLLAKCC